METTSAGVEELAGSLRLAVARTARRLRQRGDSPLSPSLHAALVTVSVHGPLTPSELARREGVQRPNATKLIARLEADELVGRTSDPFDARSSLIEVTPAGATLLREARERKDAYLADRLAGLPARDRATLARAAQLLDEML